MAYGVTCIVVVAHGDQAKSHQYLQGHSSTRKEITTPGPMSNEPRMSPHNDGQLWGPVLHFKAVPLASPLVYSSCTFV
eukprot:scaffold4364_cov119-Isochrysis_galbana.AAC.4